MLLESLVFAYIHTYVHMNIHTHVHTKEPTLPTWRSDLLQEMNLILQAGQTLTIPVQKDYFKLLPVIECVPRPVSVPKRLGRDLTITYIQADWKPDPERQQLSKNANMHSPLN